MAHISPTASARITFRIGPTFAHALSRGLGSSLRFARRLRPRRNSVQNDGLVFDEAAAAFYVRFGFEPVPSAPPTLFMPTETIRQFTA